MLDAGTYYLRVTSAGSTGSYVLHLRRTIDVHGNTLQDATPVALPSETASAIDPRNDADWFAFEATASGELTAETTGGLDTVGWLYANDGTQHGNLLAHDDSGAGLNFRIQHQLDAGTSYYVEVKSIGGATGSYALRLGFEASGDTTADDHGDDRASATHVELPSETAGEIDPGSDADWFRFEVATSGEVTAETSGDLDTVGALYDSAGNMLATNDDASGNWNFHIQKTLDAGTYYVRVTSFGSRTGSYALRLAFEDDGELTADDHGDDRDWATDVELPSETAGRIDPRDDEDWFRFEVAASGEATAESTGDLNYGEGLGVGRLALYDSTGNVLANAVVSGKRTFRIQQELDAGTYYIRVWSSIGGAMHIGNFTYALRLGFEASDEGTTAAGPAGDHLRSLGDFNGDGRDDVLLRHADGRWRYYPMDGATVLAGSDAADLTRDLAWRIAGVGDFDGDGKDDVLLRKTDGRWYFYPMDGRNVLAGRGTVRMTRDPAWQVAGIGDLDGDGKDDVLMRHADGRWHYYRMNGRRPLAGSGSGRLTRDLNWQMAGVGDFDGDGRDDVLLRRRDDGRWYFYPMNGRASIAGRGTVPLTRDLAWAVAGVGDFDADGRHDVLLRHTDGRWRYYPLQGRRVLDGAGLVNLTDDATTTVAGIGDLNGDGREDVLARLANGGWQYYALDGRRVLSASGEAALSGDLAWAALSLPCRRSAGDNIPRLRRVPADGADSGRHVHDGLAEVRALVGVKRKTPAHGVDPGLRCGRLRSDIRGVGCLCGCPGMQQRRLQPRHRRMGAGKTPRRQRALGRCTVVCRLAVAHDGSALPAAHGSRVGVRGAGGHDDAVPHRRNDHVPAGEL